jgi:hypothetical protein
MRRSKSSRREIDTRQLFQRRQPADEETSSIQAKSQHRRVSRILFSQMHATIRRRVTSFAVLLLDQQKWRKVVARMFE